MTRDSVFAALLACGVMITAPSPATAQKNEAPLKSVLKQKKQPGDESPSKNVTSKKSIAGFDKEMSIEQSVFGTTPDGDEVKIYTLTNANGVVLKLIDYGAAIQSLKVPDKNGKLLEMQLGYNTLDEYLNYGSHFGCAVGRFANRIAGGKFTLEGKEYTLAKNNGPNHLHGGPTGFGKRVWKSRAMEVRDAKDGPRHRQVHLSQQGRRGRLPW